MELEDRVHAELLENPALEEGKEESTSDETTPAENGISSACSPLERLFS